MFVLLLFLVAINDPRISLVQLQIDGHNEAALEATSELIEEDPETADRLGLHYLEGHLLDTLGRRAEATSSYARTLTATPKLAPYARLRIAIDQELLGHPEVAAGLTATLLGSDPPNALISRGAVLLVRTIEQGGDCRLLSGLLETRFNVSARRLIQLAQADCELRAGHAQLAQQRLVGLLREKSSDVTALLAAQRLSRFKEAVTEPTTLVLLGLTFHHHREFDRSSDLLQQIVVQLQPRVRTTKDFKTRYQYVRSQFWLGRYELAAQHYGDLASRTVLPRQTAQALYHRSRSLELAGHWPAAADSFLRSYAAQPQGSFAGASLIGALRLEWRSGREERALQLYETLGADPQSRAERSRAALFLAASDLSLGRTDRAARWLDDARTARGNSAIEASYWRGRLAAADGDVDGAIDQYLKAIRREYFHPVSQFALSQLESPQLAERAIEQATRLASQSDRLFDAWILLGIGDRPLSLRDQVRIRLERRLERENGGLPILNPVSVEVADWPLWSTPLTRPEELLLALGVWDEGAPVASRHFPLANPSLALIAAGQLQRVDRTRESLLIAENLRKRVPRRVPEAFWPRKLRTALYPYAYRYLIERSAERHKVDPLLLTALIREESKFDPRAASAASARGLTQFVIATANRIAREHGMGSISPRQLEQPEVAIELGAAYLRELLNRYGEGWPQSIAAYNAGEPQAHLWRRYCYSADPAEFYTKVAFQETRNYLRRVLTSYAQYHQLYTRKPTSATD